MLAIGKQLTPEQRLSKAVVDIMGNPKYVALAGVLMIGDRSVVDNIPTACTNGRDEMYGRDFVDSLNDAELRFLVLHEVYHKLYKHLTTIIVGRHMDLQTVRPHANYPPARQLFQHDQTQLFCYHWLDLLTGSYPSLQLR